MGDDDIALAGEYVLGLLPEAERVAFEERLVREPALRQVVMDWDENFASLAEALPPVDPPAMIEARVQARLFGAAPRKGWFAPWMGALAAAVLAAVVVAAVFWGGPDAPAGAPTHRAEISSDTGPLLLTASVSAETGDLSITRVAGEVPEGRVLELWLIAEAVPQPVSLGVVPESGPGVLIVADDHRALLSGAVLAVSDEPPGGSPTGQATGSVLAIGQVVPLAEN